MTMSLFSALAFVWVLSFVFVEASVHDYAAERFVPKGNAFVVHGGSEGIYFSVPDRNETDISADGESFIR